MPLPPGLALVKSTGQLVGIPTQPGSFTFTLRVRDAQGNFRDIEQTIEIVAYTPPVLSGALLQYATSTIPYSSGLTASGGEAPLAWSIAAGTLPAGMSINSATGLISGTPAEAGPYTDRTITVRVTDALGAVASLQQTIQYRAQMLVDFTAPPAIVGQPYSFSVADNITQGHPPYSYSLSGALPPGLSWNATTGRITGTPTLAGSFLPTLTVTDSSGYDDSSGLELIVGTNYTPISIAGAASGTSSTYESRSGAFAFSPSYAGLSVAGGLSSKTYSWARVSGSTSISASAPSSLATGFSGTVAPGGSASAVFRLTVSDGRSSATYDVTISVTNEYVAPSIVPASGGDLMTRTRPYSAVFGVAGGKPPYVWAVTGGSLPAGVTLNTSTGTVSGTPTGTSYGSLSVTLRVTDADGGTATIVKAYSYKEPPVLAGGALARATRTVAYSSSAAVTNPGTTHPLTYSIASGTLPAGLALNEATGVISGTPTSTSYGTVTVTIRAEDATFATASAVFTIAYADALTLAESSPDGTVGDAYAATATPSGGHAPYTYSISAGALPPGVTLNSGTGALSGTPTAAGSYSWTLRAQDAAGNVATAAGGATIAAGNEAVLTNRVIGDSTLAFSPASATAVAGIRLRSTGVLQTRRKAVYTDVSGQWLPSGSPGDYEARLTIVSSSGASVTGGWTAGSWVAMSSDREAVLSISRASVGSSSASAELLIEVRKISGGAIVSATISLGATANVEA